MRQFDETSNQKSYNFVNIESMFLVKIVYKDTTEKKHHTTKNL